MIEAINNFSETAETIGMFFTVIRNSLGFLGIECIILLIISFIFLFFINQINAIFPKFNYFFVISISVILALSTGMSLEGIAKYISVMLFPMFLSVVSNLTANIIKNKLQRS